MRLWASLGVGLLLTTVVAADEKKAFDAKKLEGKWTYTEGARAGEKIDKERLQAEVVIAKETIVVPAGPDMKFTMGFKLDTKASPINIDIEIKDGPFKDSKAVGILALEGDVLKLCYSPSGMRPQKFESTKDNGAFYFVLKRAK